MMEYKPTPLFSLEFDIGRLYMVNSYKPTTHYKLSNIILGILKLATQSAI